MTRAELETRANLWLAADEHRATAEHLARLLVETFNDGITACDAKLAERHNHHDRQAVRALRIETRHSEDSPEGSPAVEAP